jgi:FG-GAP repeat protein
MNSRENPRMKPGDQILRVLPVIVLVCSLLPVPAQAQFFQQGPKLVGTGALGDAFQGNSVALSGDGNNAIVGAPFDNGNAGAAWIYARSGGVWNHQAKLVGTGAIGPAEQGYSVSLSGDGNTAIVGGLADNDGIGAAWVYMRSGGVWSQQAKLVGTGAIGPADQGFSVALAGDGNTAIDAGKGVWRAQCGGRRPRVVQCERAAKCNPGILRGLVSASALPAAFNISCPLAVRTSPSKPIISFLESSSRSS